MTRAEAIKHERMKWKELVRWLVDKIIALHEENKKLKKGVTK